MMVSLDLAAIDLDLVLTLAVVVVKHTTNALTPRAKSLCPLLESGWAGDTLAQ